MLAIDLIRFNRNFCTGVILLFSIHYASTAPVQRSLPPIRFTPNGTLKIAIFADLHYGEAPYTDWGPEDDLNSTKVMRDVLQMENPDFVVFTGDQVTGDAMFRNVSRYIDMLLAPVVERQIRFSSVYGNHDTGPMVDRNVILRTEQAYEDLCYTQQMVPELPGVSNYYIPIYGPGNGTATEKEEKPVMLWWFLDSQGGFTLAGRKPYYIDEQVVQWFRNESRQLQEKWGTLPTLVFFHIPTVEYTDVQESVQGNPLCSGLVDDAVTPQEKDTGIMQALLEVGGVRTIFVGHEHGNSWCCFYKEVEICYNRHTGYGGYGEWTRGARIVQLDYNSLGNQTNYVRLENGEITDRFPKP